MKDEEEEEMITSRGLMECRFEEGSGPGKLNPRVSLDSDSNRSSRALVTWTEALSLFEICLSCVHPGTPILHLMIVEIPFSGLPGLALNCLRLLTVSNRHS